MIRIRDISLPPDHDEKHLLDKAAHAVKIGADQITRLTKIKKSIDARKKPDIRYIYTVDIEVRGNEQKIIKNSKNKKVSISKPYTYEIRTVTKAPNKRPLVIGFGPAGMFAALVLAKAGLQPLVLERGADAKTRHKKVSEFFKSGTLDTECNVQFGEGGAGTFSDGKLNTGISNPRIQWVLEQFVNAGAPENILYDAKPHIGTDILIDVVQNIREQIISLGGEIRFNTKANDFIIENGNLTAVKLSSGEEIRCDKAILAIGHSARDTFRMLFERDVPMEPKPFSIGVRIEHKQSDINCCQYANTDYSLPAADYKLYTHLEDGTVYTFCMCPGGYVVAATSNEGHVVTNGMSYSDRSGENANSALLVTVNPKDFPYDGALGGAKWQDEIEKAAFIAGGGNYNAPAQLVGDFLSNKKSEKHGRIVPTYKPGVTWCNLNDVLPKKISNSLKDGIMEFAKKIPAFNDADAVMTAPETRSSSPIKIIRNDNRESVISGIYPTGEGAGYAGGIMSAAIDGMMSAEAIIDMHS